MQYGTLHRVRDRQRDQRLLARRQRAVREDGAVYAMNFSQSSLFPLPISANLVRSCG